MNGTASVPGMIGGTAEMRYLNPTALILSRFQGPVIQNGALPEVKAAVAMSPVTLELIRPDLFQPSMMLALAANTLLKTPMFLTS